MTVAGPGPCEKQADGACHWTIVTCPDSASQNSDPECPKDKPLVQCVADPCISAKCAPGTACKSNYCGGCNYTCEPI